MTLKPWIRNSFFIISVMLVVALAASTKFGLYFNMSESLPGKAFLIVKGSEPKPGQLFAFRYHGDRFFPENVLMVKYLRGVSGERVDVKDREVFVDTFSVGVAKPQSKLGITLHVTQPGIIPEKKLYAYSPSLDSYDSRYSTFGLIDKADVVGKVIKVF